jgi:hypothetical protein
MAHFVEWLIFNTVVIRPGAGCETQHTFSIHTTTRTWRAKSSCHRVCDVLSRGRDRLADADPPMGLGCPREMESAIKNLGHFSTKSNKKAGGQ